ncbi:PREDICTED: SPOC domain-containing protein 1-like, partial [Chrysochloris asiatica]|uniref:SPOC domain-containing protein 1-like n=1 Tax=Chrysochloris asiatica TaxID=185453 RepID=A0A9B0TBG6_CHRAS
MFQEEVAEGSRTEDPVLSPRGGSGPFQEDVEGVYSMPVLVLDGLCGAGHGKYALTKETHAGISSQPVGGLGFLAEKCDYLPAAGDGIQPGSPCDPVGPPLLSGREALRPAPEDPPQSPTLYLRMSAETSITWPEVEHLMGTNSDDRPTTSHSQEELEVKAQARSWERWKQKLPAPSDTHTSSLEPVANLSTSLKPG